MVNWKFWNWFKKNKPHYLFRCGVNYDDLYLKTDGENMILLCFKYEDWKKISLYEMILHIKEVYRYYGMQNPSAYRVFKYGISHKLESYDGKYFLGKFRRPFMDDLPIYCRVESGKIVNFCYKDGKVIDFEWLRNELERYGLIDMISFIDEEEFL